MNWHKYIRLYNISSEFSCIQLAYDYIIQKKNEKNDIFWL